jgi:hypothetical protein
MSKVDRGATEGFDGFTSTGWQRKDPLDSIEAFGLYWYHK